MFFKGVWLSSTILLSMRFFIQQTKQNMHLNNFCNFKRKIHFDKQLETLIFYTKHN